VGRNDNVSNEWFPEPTERDETYANRLESTPAWLARSTLDLAKECRSFLNRNLAALPDECQEGIAQRLKTDMHHRSAFFELVVARMLQELEGAIIACEPENPVDGTKIDFVVRFPDYEIGVEATSPLFDREMGGTAKDYAPLIEVVEEMAPSGWAVAIGSLPSLGPSDSKKPFKSAVKQMLNVPPPLPGEGEREVRWELPEGEVRLTLFSKAAHGLREKSKIVWEAPMTTIDDSKRVIRNSVEGKRRQARNVPVPVLVALDAKGIVTRLEDFDMALFGHSVAHMNQFGKHYATSFQADGLFAKGEGEPTISGVLAFTEVGFLRCNDPILYLHPRFEDHLPDALLQLERRTLSAGGVCVREAQSRGFLEVLGFVDPGS
jgi:hypothetical protein